MFRPIVFSLLLVVSALPHASAQEWARKMFKVKSHDFGTVARNSKAEYRFELQNIYEEDVHLLSVRTSCGCTEPHITKSTLKTWDKGAVLAVFNTRAFLGHRSATLTVTIDKPYFAEVQLSVRGHIRGDVVFEPGEVDFGDIAQGTKAEKTVTISYAGRSNWDVVDVRSANPHFEVELGEASRNYGRVSYRMLVRLKDDAPAGYLSDQLTIVTNDSSGGTLELPIQGRVVSPLTVSPASLFLGVLQPGQTVTKNMVVRGKTAFKIVAIDCPDQSFQFKTEEKAKKLHLVPVTFTAGTKSGKISQKIQIKTDLGAGTATCCTASATIVAQAGVDQTQEEKKD